MRNNKISFFVILCACLLIVVGDFRFIISSVGYWVLWFAVIFMGLFFAPLKFSLKITLELFVCLSGFILILISFILSGLVNQDVYTFYQGGKMACITLAFICIYANVRSLNGRDLCNISLACIFAGLIIFLISKYIYRDMYIVLGDGRQGSQFAYPGVLWKTPVFFVGFVVAGMVSGVVNKKISMLALISSIYLLLADSSRTGFLILSVMVFLFIMLYAYFKPQTVIACFIALTLFFVLLFILYNEGGWVSVAEEPLVLNRLTAGDPVRTKMLIDGFLHAQDCIPFGCGFGTAITLINNVGMVVHNVYLSSIGDLGVLGFTGIVILVLFPIFIFLNKLWFCVALRVKHTENIAFSVAAFGGVLGYALLMMFHPFSTELSEWGIWMLMISFLFSFSQRMVACGDEIQVKVCHDFAT